MSVTLEQIQQEALALPPEERAQLVDKLWESLDGTARPPLSDEWRSEVERRRQEILAGKCKSIPGEEVSAKAWKIVESTHS